MAIVFCPPPEQESASNCSVCDSSPDQYEQAVEDMLACLQLREFVLEPTDRRLAEVYE